MRAAVFVEKLYEELELWYPYFRLKEAGIETVIAGPEAGHPYASKTGYPAVAEIGFAALRAAEYDAVIVPGGFAPDYMRRNEHAVRFVAEMNAAGKLVAAICHGPWMLCSADVLRGRRATSFSSIKADVVHAGASWKDAEVVVDSNLVTSRKPEDLPAFARACLMGLGMH